MGFRRRKKTHFRGTKKRLTNLTSKGGDFNKLMEWWDSFLIWSKKCAEKGYGKKLKLKSSNAFRANWLWSQKSTFLYDKERGAFWQKHNSVDHVFTNHNISMNWFLLFLYLMILNFLDLKMGSPKMNVGRLYLLIIFLFLFHNKNKYNFFNYHGLIFLNAYFIFTQIFSSTKALIIKIILINRLIILWIVLCTSLV